MDVAVLPFSFFLLKYSDIVRFIYERRRITHLYTNALANAFERQMNSSNNKRIQANLKFTNDCQEKGMTIDVNISQ